MADWERAFKELLAVRGASLRAYAYLLTGESAAAPTWFKTRCCGCSAAYG
ncbi:hypothetical protein EV644_103271 [Kribbella orskensis]|uniref:Uncharacterized protein n=1 Tax=Kribbella orskensis TaxID=2512216 RepID=A0ABY2BS41_9ACTN|nr:MULTISPECIES: hypothetical protein [Kribbella]TCN39645.1 hypothetical protein EV642_106149 [Kribbella sp. VKM Ac-2500]TCO27572.1 hypothetical protein EV644_103271 [Kribbella orskensis]